MTRPLPAALTALLCALCAGCADNTTQLCPSNSTSVGAYTLSLAFQPGSPDECRITRSADGGSLDASLATTPAPRDSALCISSDGGAPTLILAVRASTGPLVLESALGDGGTFVFINNPPPTQPSSTACACTLLVTETIQGQLLSASGDGGVTYSPDAGLSPVRGYSGTFTDTVDGGPECRCTVPCAQRYSLTGTRQ